MSQSSYISEVQKWQEVATEAYCALLDSLPDSVVIIAANGSIVFINKQVESWFGYKNSELIGQPLEILIPERYRQAHRHHRVEYIERVAVPRPMGVGLDLYGIRKNGTEFPVDISIAPMHTMGNKFIAAVIRDITEKVKLEKQRHKAIKDRETLQAMVTHDLKNLLTSIMLSSELAKNQLSKMEDVSEAKASIERILHSGKHMNELIEKALMLKKEESKTLPTERQTCFIRNLVHQAFQIMEPLARRKSLEMTKTIPTESMPILCDRKSILQVLINLLSNAIKYSEPGGRIHVELAFKGDLAQVSVADTGYGISIEALPHVFDPYWQEKRINNEGVGLGLAIVKLIIETHRGKVWVESKKGKGSTFYFVLPIHRLT